MNDLVILNKIGKILNIEFKEIPSFDYYSNAHGGYVFEKTQGITGLNLENCEIDTLDLILEELRQLKKLTRLKLSTKTHETNGLRMLTNLTHLDVADSNVHLETLLSLPKLISLGIIINSDRIDIIGSLVQLEELVISNQSIHNISFTCRLTRLKKLYLNCQLLSDVSGIEELQLLKSLTIHSSRLANIKPILRIKNLIHLSLFAPKLIDIAGIDCLTTLRSLLIEGNFSRTSSSKANTNRSFDITPISSLYDLSDLSLNFLGITDINPIKTLTKLIELNIYDNKIVDISILSELVNLEHLYIKNNDISDISPLQDLVRLTELLIYQNRITDISPLRNLKRLTTLGLDDNRVESLPFWITDFNMNISTQGVWKKGHITLSGNPINNLPLEILNQGKEAIKRYFDDASKTGLRPLNECKLIFVGDGEVGKTSLMKRIVFGTYKDGEKTTHGINKIAWDGVVNNKGEKVKINLWDFGGQHIQHSMHGGKRCCRSELCQL